MQVSSNEYRLALALAPATVSAKSQLRLPMTNGRIEFSHEIFGEFIDRYTIKEAEADGATVPVLYEGRTAQGAIKDGASLDELFEDLFRQRTPEELEAIKRKYATKGHIFDAPALIADKARDMLRHYVTNILPNGYKAQVVAYSRLAAIRYFAVLKTARDELLPARIAEYVVVHEIAHLHEPHHTPTFWLHMERVMPDYAQRKAWLAEHGMDVEGI